MKLIFKQDDFKCSCHPAVKCRCAAELAQNVFDNWIKEIGLPVYGPNKGDLNADWWLYKREDSTHKGVLINIEPIEKCTHPKDKVKLHHYNAPLRSVYECECGINVKPTGFEAT